MVGRVKKKKERLYASVHKQIARIFCRNFFFPSTKVMHIPWHVEWQFLPTWTSSSNVYLKLKYIGG